MVALWCTVTLLMRNGTSGRPVASWIRLGAIERLTMTLLTVT
jgi:hypothetical protein